MADCPHDDIRFCPLYVASHGASGPLGCIRAGPVEFECDVDRGRLDYWKAVGRLYLKSPDLVDECRSAERQHEAREQRRRNLKLNGIH